MSHTALIPLDIQEKMMNLTPGVSCTWDQYDLLRKLYAQVCEDALWIERGVNMHAYLGLSIASLRSTLEHYHL